MMNSFTKKIFVTYQYDFFALLAITLVIGIFFIRFFFPTPKLLLTPDMGLSDAFHFGFATKYELWNRTHQGSVPLWSDKTGNGFPLVGEGQIGAYYPISFIMNMLFDPVRAFSMTLFFTMLISAYGMYFLVRTRISSALLAFYGGVTYALSAFMVLQIVHIMLVSGIAFFPWVLGFTYILAKKGTIRISLALIIPIVMQILAGFPQAAFNTALTAGVYFLCLTWKKPDWPKKMILFIFAYVFAFLIGAVQIIPSYEFMKQTGVKEGIPLKSAIQYSFSPDHLLTFFDPFLIGNPKTGTYFTSSRGDGNIFWENNGYIGLLPLFLSVISIVFYKQSTHKAMVLLYSSIVAVSVLLMMGKYSPTYLLYAVWPFNLFRVPARFVWTLDIFIILLSIEGFLILSKKIPFPKTVFSALILVHTTQLLITWYSYHLLIPADRAMAKPETYSVLDSNPTVLTLNVMRSVYFDAFLKTGWTDGDERYVYINNSLQPNSNLIWPMTQSAVYGGRTLRRHDIAGAILSRQYSEKDRKITMKQSGVDILSLFGIEYIISPYPVTNDVMKLVLKTDSNIQPLFVYRHTGTVLPKYYVLPAKNGVYAGTYQDVLEHIKNSALKPGRMYFTENSADGGGVSTASATISVLTQSDEHVTFGIKAPDGNDILIVNRSFYPGWVAKTSGKTLPVIPVNVYQMGIKLPQGEYDLQLNYEPFSTTVGTVVSCLALTVYALTWIYSTTVSSRGISILRRSFS